MQQAVRDKIKTLAAEGKVVGDTVEFPYYTLIWFKTPEGWETCTVRDQPFAASLPIQLSYARAH